MRKQKVLYISGSTRSGSTLLARILGNVESFFNTGELHSIWEQGFLKNRLCGCGQPFKDCETWRSILTEAFGDVEQFGLDSVMRLCSSVSRVRYLPFFTFPALSPGFRKRLRSYSDILADIYNAAHKVTGDKVFVDSSKRFQGHILQSNPRINLYVVHLVRDSRAVAFSWKRRKVYQKVGDELLYMAQYGSAMSSFYWLTYNLSGEILKAQGAKYMFVRYEDFMRDPRQTVQEIVRFTGEGSKALPFTDDNTVTLHPSHTVWGNPSRFEEDVIRIRSDDEWKHAMPVRTKRIVELLTLPLLRRYGFTRKFHRP